MEATDQAPSADRVSKAKRSRIMAAVKGKNTSSEIKVRKALHAAGFRFRLHRKDLPGKPDIVLPRYRVVVMVHGCLWHGHQCKRFRWPVANASYWRSKIERNMARDCANTEALQHAGWTVKVVWDCQLKEGIATLLRDLGRLKEMRTFLDQLRELRNKGLAHRLAAGLPPITHKEIRSYIAEGRL